MSTNIPVTGIFQVTCEFKRKGNWKAGFHTGIDLYCSNSIIYGTCDAIITKIGYDASYGNYIVARCSSGFYHWFCHLSRINCVLGQEIGRTTKIGIMGSTGNSTGTHLHYEIRNVSNKYGDVINPAEFMGIPNQVGTYNSANYPKVDYARQNPELKTLIRNTNLRDEPTTSSPNKTLYLANTTLYVIEPNVAKNDGFTWDKVKIRVNGKIGYMINENYE